MKLNTRVKTSPIFPEPRDLGKRPWGKEELLVLILEIHAKKIDHRSWFERRTSIPQTEKECGYLLSGRLIIRHENENGVLTERIIMPGDSFHFPPGVVHQERPWKTV